MIDVFDYSPLWPSQFEEAAGDLRSSCPGLFVHVEHIGSTSVPQLPAKPIIDIMAAVRTLEDVDQHQVGLSRLGYRYYEIGMPRRLFFRRSEGVLVTHHLHVVETSDWTNRHERVFRDWLSTHPALRDEYGQLKRRLAAETSDAFEYTKAKTDFVQRVIDAARHERGLPPVPVWEEDPERPREGGPPCATTKPLSGCPRR